MRFDAVVLGAGIVGVCSALHLQARGRSVALVDRRGVGMETSYGNAGLIERASIVPYAFPQGFKDLLRYGLNREMDARYHLLALPRLARWLFSYWRASTPKRLAEATADMLPLIERCLVEHEALIQQAGAGELIVRRGWIDAYRTGEGMSAAVAEAEALAPYGLSWTALDRKGLSGLEPHLSDRLIGGIHWQDPASIRNPAGLAQAYAALFEQRGGKILTGDARTLQSSGVDWTVATDAGPLTARDVVVALGPWSDDVFGRLGYRIPLAVKRGYHMHYAPAGQARLNQTVLDAERGYVLAPMNQGIRLTTGVEFGNRETPPTPVQLAATEPVAREIFPLGERLDPEPWLGRRPAIADMRPVIGPAPNHKGLWFAFGHAHHGLTLAAVTGRLIADLVTVEEPVVDPFPYRATRFG